MRNSGSWKREQKRKAAGKDGSKRGYGKLYRRDLYQFINMKTGLPFHR